MLVDKFWQAHTCTHIWSFIQCLSSEVLLSYKHLFLSFTVTFPWSSGGKASCRKREYRLFIVPGDLGILPVTHSCCMVLA